MKTLLRSYIIINMNIILKFLVLVDEVKVAIPVLVYIHGESFSWSSGNPYDGAVLSSYTDLIIVTINFRLGILGK